MPSIELLITVRIGCDTHTVEAEFDLDTGIDDYVEEFVGGEYGNDAEILDCEQVSVSGFYLDSWDLANFTNLAEFGEFAEATIQYGEAYELRHDDVGDHGFSDSYEGCWDCVEDFVRDLYTECHEIPASIKSYIDWEHLARDVMMDYSDYDGDDGVHIFRD